MPLDPVQFTTLDPLDGTSRAGALVEYMEPNNNAGFQPPPCSGCSLRILASARYIVPDIGVGGYVRLPVAYADEPTSATALGDLELGAIYASPTSGVTVHVGVTLPTGDDGFPERTAAFVEATPMLRDYVQAIPDGTSARVGISGRWRDGYLAVQIDAGVDANFSSVDATSYGAMFHGDLGIAITDGTSALMLELANLAYLDGNDSGADIPATTLDTLAVSARLQWHRLSPFFAVVAPLDGDTAAVFKLAVIAGVDVDVR